MNLKQAISVAVDVKKTRLDLILDTVKRGKHDVTFDTDGYTPAQVDMVIAAAKARGFHVSRDRRFVLVRDM
jgi:hypothetical protein